MGLRPGVRLRLRIFMKVSRIPWIVVFGLCAGTGVRAQGGESSALRWSVAPESGGLTVTTPGAPVDWRSAVPAEIRYWDGGGKELAEELKPDRGWKIERLASPAGGWRLQCRKDALGIALVLNFDAQDDGLVVRVPAAELTESGPARLKSLRLLPQFGAARDGDDGYLVIAQQSGALCHFKDKQPGQHWVSVYQGGSCQCAMPIFGAVRGTSALAAIITGGQFDAKLCVSVNWGAEHQYAIDPTFALRSFREESRLAEDLTVEYHVLQGTRATWLGIGKQYREFNFARRGIRPLRERAATSPALAYAADAMEVRIRLGVKPVPYEVKEQTPDTEPPMRVFCDFVRLREILDEFHRQGIPKAEFCLVGWNKSGHDGRYPQIYPVEPALGGEEALRQTIKHGQALGYQMVAHDCYYDAYRISADWNEEFLRKDAAGKPVKGGAWGGGQSYNMCLEQSLGRFAKRDLPRTRALGFQGLHYTDVLSIIGPRPCYDPRHPASRRQDAEAATRILTLAKETFGGVQSEGSLDYTAPALDQLLYVDCDKWLPLLKRPYVDERVPLYESVYHGVLLYNLSTDTVNAQPGEDAYLRGIEYGAVPLTYFYGHFLLDASKNWLGKNDYRYDDAAGLKQIVATLKQVSDDVQRLKHLQREFLEDHRNLADGVVETCYSNGQRVVVNYREQPYALPAGKTVPARGFAVVPATENPSTSSTDWLKEAQLGAFMHFLPGDPGSFAKVNDFDVNALAGQLEAMGAKYFVFTLGQNSGWFNAPNATYDRITGYRAGERCALRDLPLELSRALEPKGIRLMLYLPCQTPNRDARAQRAFGLAEGPKDQSIDVAFAAKWADVIREWSLRYGKKVSGWWFDGGYVGVKFNEDIARLYAAAVKAGNPQAIATFNPGVKLIRYTEAEDYTAGELNEPFDLVPSGRWVAGSQWHALTFLGATWGKRDVRYPTGRWREWFQKVRAGGGAVTLDMGPNWLAADGPIGSVAEAQARQFQEIAKP